MQQSSSERQELTFELMAEIAVGATARVELCRIIDGPLAGELVAVKRLHPHVSEDPAIIDMFRDEVWMTAALEHPHVVKLVGWGQNAAGPWLAVELVRGVSLQRLMKTVFGTGEQFSERMVVFIARCICDGLAEAHSLRSADGQLLNLVHRDLTPGNVLLGFGGQVKITDFGLAKAKQRLTKTLTGLVKGQPQYMSPEQVKGAAIDARSDLFALGVMLFELFVGRRPWTATTELEAMRAITDEPPLALGSLRSGLDPALVQVVERCLQKEPADRSQSATELRDRFDDWLMAHGYRRDNDTALGRFVRRNAMRQMRWFERAVAGELAEQACAKARQQGEGGGPSVSPPAANAEVTPSGLEKTGATRKGDVGTSPTLAEAPHSRGSVASGRAQEGSDSGVQALRAPAVGSAAPPAVGHGGGVRAPGDIDWGEDGPTLIQRPAAASSAPPLAPEARTDAAAGEPTTRRQRGRPAGASQPFGSGVGLGVPAPPDPNTPPLPSAPPESRGARVGATSAARGLPTGAAPPTAVDHDDAPTIQTRVPLPPGDSTAELPPAGARLAAVPVPVLPAMPSPEERSSDFLAEARRLGEEANGAAEAARHAADVAVAAARAAALAAEASLLAATGAERDAVQRLREAQLVDEALRRGEIPHRMPPGAGSRLLGKGTGGALGRMATLLASREGVTAVVVGTVALLALLVLVVSLIV